MAMDTWWCSPSQVALSLPATRVLPHCVRAEARRWRAGGAPLKPLVEKVVTGHESTTRARAVRLRLMRDTVASLDVLRGGLAQVHACREQPAARANGVD